MKKEPEEVIDSELDLSLDTNELETVDISDTKLEEEDKKKISAKKEAKKTAKKLLSPEDKARLRKKRLVIAGAITAVLSLILLAAPFTRWPILNAVGFRGNLVLTIEDTENQPVSGATARLSDNTTAVSDEFGRAHFQSAPLGKQSVLIQKNGYGDKTTALINGLGTTKKTEQLKIIGIKLDIDIQDWLSDQVIEGATVSFGESTATSDSTGRASLVIPPTDKKVIAVTVAAPGYLSKTIETETAVVSREVALVSAEKNYFISKRDGKFDIFSSNLDGSDQRKIIEATGKEDESLLQLSINRNNKQAILVATRDGKIQNGRLVAGIYSIDLERAALQKVDEGSDVQLLGWGDNALVYTKSSPELNYDDPTLSRLMNFNTANGRLSQIATTNYFQAGAVAQNKVFYVPADAYRPIENGVLTSHDLNSGATKTYLQDKQINYISRGSYAALELQDTAGGTFELQIANGAIKAIDRRPATSLMIVLSPNGQSAAWSERRDGQGALIARSIKEGTEKAAVKAGGLIDPVRFVTDNLAIVRVATSQETADYVVSIPSGKLRKVVDVSNVGNNRQTGF